MTRRWSFNPFSGMLEPTESPSSIEFAEKIADIFTCNESVQVGDLVRASTVTEETVETITSNVYDDIVIGLVISKPTAGTCEVLFSGKVEDIGLSGLSFGKVIWVGVTGEITTTRPTAGHIQKLGVAIKSNKIFLLPSTEKVILS